MKIYISTQKTKLMINGVGTVNLSTKHKFYSQLVVNLTTLLLFNCCFTIQNHLNLSLLNCKKGSRYLSSLLNLRIDKIFSDLRDIQSNINTEFKVWFTFIDVAKSVAIEPTLPRTARCWSRYRNNVPGEDILPKFYYNPSKE